MTFRNRQNQCLVRGQEVTLGVLTGWGSREHLGC